MQNLSAALQPSGPACAPTAKGAESSPSAPSCSKGGQRAAPGPRPALRPSLCHPRIPQQTRRPQPRPSSPASLLAGHRALGVVLAVVEVRHQVVQSHDGRAAKHSIVAGDLQLGEHVAHDARHGAEVGDRHHAAVHGAGLLLGEPLRDAGIAEGVLTVRSLRGEERRAAILGAGEAQLRLGRS